jgi:hypothetical protein
MNLFRIDNDPAVTASQLADRHVRKMVLEGAQILCTAVRLVVPMHLYDRAELYKVAHKHHPVTRYCTSRAGARDVLAHSLALADEYRFRWSKQHASEAVLIRAALFIDFLPEIDIDNNLPIPPLCVDEDLRTLPDHDAYRAHLLRKYQTWKRPPLWTNRQRPEWTYEEAATDLP